MSEAVQPPARQTNQPPPAPPLPPSRLGPFQRLVAPLGLARGTRPTRDVSAPSQRAPLRTVSRQTYGTLPSQTAAHRTGIPIAALDINAQGTHAILAGKDILKTVRVQDGRATEEFNLRSDILSYASAHGLPHSDATNERRSYLPARDVKWSVGTYDHIIATAAVTGRIALYDVRANGSRVELAWLKEHRGQVNKLDFDPSHGYNLLSASSDKHVFMWDIRDGKGTKAKLHFHINSGVRDVKWAPKDSNNTEFAVCADGGIIQKWDARNPNAALLSISAHDKGCYTLDWHPDGRHVVTGGFDKYVRVWDFKSDNRRQKPTFQFRAHQAIRTVRWRPPCWSSEVTESGTWQTTQVATTYHHNDPRIHVWDFRRPLLPFREIDMYNTPANDILWASKDLLWTVGDQGMFTQNDVTFASQVHGTLAPCALGWTPNSECVAFSEERLPKKSAGVEDPAVSFLSIPQEKLSGSGDEVIQSGSFEDDDNEVANESLLSTSLQKRHPIGMSSLGSSHVGSPGMDSEHLVAPLQEAVLSGIEQATHDDQTGVFSRIEGAAAEPDVVSFLANHYSPISTEKERRNSPNEILDRLQRCFTNNADVCDEVSLHRMAQSWRILSAVIIPELRDWAALNRVARKASNKQQHHETRSAMSEAKNGDAPSFAKISARDPSVKSNGTPEKPVSNIFKGLKVSETGRHDENSSGSNISTPLARPMERSPLPSQHERKATDSMDSISGMEQIQSLPPSLLNAHSTAAAAADALADRTSTGSRTPPSSPEQERQRSSPPKETVRVADRTEAPLQSPSSRPRVSKGVRSPRSHPTQEERRAALRDYRAQPRPVFSLDAHMRSPKYQKDSRHDSAESFPMFSTSSSSSYMPSLAQSAESREESLQPQARGWLSRQDSSDSAASEVMETRDAPVSTKPDGHDIRDFSSSSSATDFALDGTSRSRDFSSHPMNGIKDQSQSQNPAQDDAAISSSPEIFQFDAGAAPATSRIPMTNPALKESVKVEVASHEADTTEDDSEKDGYVFSDLRPIDLSNYEPQLPFAWSALPLVCQMIAFDMDNGVACAQFAVHLALHLSPYFFHKSPHRPSILSAIWPMSLAERLMRPDLSRRVIEGLLLKHCSFLQHMQLYESFAEIRKACAELGFDRVARNGSLTSKDGPSSNKDLYLIASACSHCQYPLNAGTSLCEHCRKPRGICPICSSLHYQPLASSAKSMAAASTSSLWSYCSSCGHSSHTLCLSTWLSFPSSSGACPVATCPCDCGPGLVRDARIEAQIQAHEESKLIRGHGSNGTVKKDGVRASQSAAVDKTRQKLRNDAAERETRSGDEGEGGRGTWGRRSSGSLYSVRGSGGRGNVGGGLTSGSRKSVRLVTPGEEGKG